MADNCATPLTNACDGCETCNGGFSLNGATCEDCQKPNCDTFTPNTCTCLTCTTDAYMVVEGDCVEVSRVAVIPKLGTHVELAGTADAGLLVAPPAWVAWSSWLTGICGMQCRMQVQVGIALALQNSQGSGWERLLSGCCLCTGSTHLNVLFALPRALPAYRRPPSLSLQPPPWTAGI